MRQRLIAFVRRRMERRKGENVMRLISLLVFAITVAFAAGSVEGATNEELVLQVRAVETAFAKTMAERDHASFESYIAGEAIFLGARGVLRGKAAVAVGWKPFFEGATAPFSWEPERVEVLDSGTLAFSTGPVRDTEGKRIGTFNSVWRREADGRWKVVFDRGCPPCEGAPKP